MTARQTYLDIQCKIPLCAHYMLSLQDYVLNLKYYISKAINISWEQDLKTFYCKIVLKKSDFTEN